MKRLALLVAVLLLAGIATGLLVPVLRAEDPTVTPASVCIRELRSSPEKFVGAPIQFEGMFHGLENLWLPFFSTFVREDYLVFSVWPNDAKVWTRDGRLDDLPTCFLRNNDPAISTLLSLKPYVPVQVSGTVLSDFHKMPWIEVTNIRVLGPARYTRAEVRERIRLAPEPEKKPGKEKETEAKPEKQAENPTASTKALQARVKELDRALATRQTEGAELRRQVEALRSENAQINVRFTTADQARRDAEKALRESKQSAASLKTRNETLTKRVSDLEGMLRTIFGSIEAATEKLKEVEKKQGDEKSADAGASEAPVQAKAD
jgi:hypothetical protein